MKSGRLYSLVTKYWPRIAAGLVVVIGLVEFVVGGLTADSGLEFYLVAWAGATGGIWFIFEKAESTISQDVRNGVRDWLQTRDVHDTAWAIPDQFAALFDLFFTPRHWSRECFNRSCLASAAAVIAVLSLKLSFGGWSRDPASAGMAAYILGWAAVLWCLLFTSTVVVVRSGLWRFALGGVFLALFLGPGVLHQLQERLILSGPIASLASLDMGALSLSTNFLAIAILLNFIPDYVSLLETRWVIRWMEGAGRLWRLVVVDALVTAFISLLFIGAFYAAVVAPSIGREFALSDLLVTVVWPPYAPVTAEGSDEFGLTLLSVSFYSAFLTSVWLWLYALGTILARLLVRMNSGLGVLLRVTDIGNQPFRSMGFVSVLIVSGLFLLGLPLVFL